MFFKPGYSSKADSLPAESSDGTPEQLLVGFTAEVLQYCHGKFRCHVVEHDRLHLFCAQVVHQSRAVVGYLTAKYERVVFHINQIVS